MAKYFGQSETPGIQAAAANWMEKNLGASVDFVTGFGPSAPAPAPTSAPSPS